VSSAAITLCVASQRVFVVDFVMTQSGNFWILPPVCCSPNIISVIISEWRIWSSHVARMRRMGELGVKGV
jgi:hypothetical protein